MAPLFVLGLLLIPTFLTVVGGTALGFLALSRIRSRWPELWGVGAATFGAWIWPLVVADIVVLVVLVGVGLVTALMWAALLGLLAGNVLVIALFRAHFLRQMRGA